MPHVKETRQKKKRRLPETLISFAELIISEQNTVLQFNDHEVGTIMLDNGIGQGDPLSMALYQYYNADILKIPKRPQELAKAYIDDAILIALAKMFKGVHEILADMMTRAGGMIEWSKSHNSSIEYSKLTLIDFAHPRVKKPCPPLILSSIMIELTQNTKYLGIVLDQNLNWASQQAHILRQGSKWAAQIKRLTRPTWSLTSKGACKLIVHECCAPTSSTG